MAKYLLLEPLESTFQSEQTNELAKRYSLTYLQLRLLLVESAVGYTRQ